MAHAVEIVHSKQQPDGRWLLDRIHPGRVHFTLEGGVGQPSRWNTLRALRVLDWWVRPTVLTACRERRMDEFRTLAASPGLVLDRVTRPDRATPPSRIPACRQPVMPGDAISASDVFDHR